MTRHKENAQEETRGFGGEEAEKGQRTSPLRGER
jgi:hypothetical protein